MNDLSQTQDFVNFATPPIAINLPLPSIWYLLRLHPNHDLKAERQLADQGISVYVPKEQKTLMAKRFHRKVKRTVPIFPGTMFVPDFEADLGRLKRYASGIGGFVKYNGEALKVRPCAMDEIRRFEAKQNRDPERRSFKKAQRVRIVEGPFALFEGPIERLDKNYRLSVLINWLGCLSAIQFDEDQVEAV